MMFLENMARKRSISWGITKNLEAVISGFVLNSKFVFTKRDMSFFFVTIQHYVKVKPQPIKQKNQRFFPLDTTASRFMMNQRTSGQSVRKCLPICQTAQLTGWLLLPASGQTF